MKDLFTEASQCLVDKNKGHEMVYVSLRMMEVSGILHIYTHEQI